MPNAAEKAALVRMLREKRVPFGPPPTPQLREPGTPQLAEPGTPTLKPPGQPSPQPSILDMDHAALYQLRSRLKDPQAQADIAPQEHYAAAREIVSANPLMALPFAVATPLYEGGKALGLIKARSPASLESLGAGWAGTAAGVAQAIRRARGKPEDEQE